MLVGEAVGFLVGAAFVGMVVVIQNADVQKAGVQNTSIQSAGVFIIKLKKYHIMRHARCWAIH